MRARSRRSRSRSFMVVAAFSVKVTAAIWSSVTAPERISASMRSTRSVVFPVPAPASRTKLMPCSRRARSRASWSTGRKGSLPTARSYQGDLPHQGNVFGDVFGIDPRPARRVGSASAQAWRQRGPQMREHSRVVFKSLVFVVSCTTPTALLAIEKDTFPGTCQQLATRIKDVGVKDAGGSHPKWPGNTRSVVEAAGFTYDIVKKATKSKFFCNANNKLYETIAECQKPPSQGGCRTVIGTIPCTPRDAEVCLDADAKITFSGTHTSTRLEWQTTVTQSKACTKDIARWYKHIETHRLSP